jgi:hypothetical protein
MFRQEMITVPVKTYLLKCWASFLLCSSHIVCAAKLSYQTNKYNTSDITSNMIPLLLGYLGTQGALMLGFTAAEVIIHYWNSKSIHPEIYIFGRRVHHGEIGALLSASSILIGKIPVPAVAIGILAGVGAGLVKDDLADIKEWFRFKKLNFIKKVPK